MTLHENYNKEFKLFPRLVKKTGDTISIYIKEHSKENLCFPKIQRSFQVFFLVRPSTIWPRNALRIFLIFAFIFNIYNQFLLTFAQKLIENKAQWV